MIKKPQTIPELQRQKGIKIDDIAKVKAKQTYYNMISGNIEPRESTLRAYAKLFDVDITTFKKLLRNTLK